MSVVAKLKSWFAPFRPLRQELLHYQTPPDAEQQYRLHLRIEADGRGLLIVNAATVLHLNQTAAEYARLLIGGASAAEAARAVARRYRVSRSRAEADFRQLQETILTLATSTDLCPVTYLGLERAEPFSAETSAPYRVDLALTYRVDESGALDPEARRRVERELSREEWQYILQRLWNAGVPHVCFTGGEPTLREELVDLVRYAEKLGMVSGLLTDGRRLSDLDYLDRLLLAGLDHVQVTLVSHQPHVHDAAVGRPGAWEQVERGLRNAVASDLYVVAHVLITEENAGAIAETMAYLAGLGVHAVALSAALRAGGEGDQARLREALETGQNAAQERGLTVVWDLAAPYSRLKPIELEAGLDPTQVIRQHLYVEPDGDVLPAQGYNVVLGNLLRDDWEAIWNHPERKKLGEYDEE